MFNFVGLVYFQSSRIKTTALRLSCELGVNGEKKVNENWDIISKSGHSTFHTGKPGNFNILREIIWIILWHSVTLKLIEDES